jgi:hypothetical protein
LRLKPAAPAAQTHPSGRKDMPIEVIVDSLDSVDESDRPFFEKNEEGKFRLDFAKRDEAIKKPLTEKTAQLKREKDKLKAFEKYKDLTDDDLKAFQDWKAKRAEDDEDDEDDPPKDDDQKGKKSDQVDVKKLVKTEIKRVTDEHTKAMATALKAKDDELAAERLKFETYRFDQELTSEALEGGIIGARLRKFKSAAVDEKIFGYHEGKLVVLDDDGEPTTESPMDRMKKLASADEWKFFFAATEAGGGSGQQKAGVKTGSKDLKRSKMSPKEKSEYIKQNGHDAFLKLPL